VWRRRWSAVQVVKVTAATSRGSAQWAPRWYARGDRRGRLRQAEHHPIRTCEGALRLLPPWSAKASAIFNPNAVNAQIRDTQGNVVLC
jgi:hypothetical protein